MTQPCALKKGKIVNVADRYYVPLVEIRAGAVKSEVVGIDKSRVAARRGVINGMAVGVGDAKLERAYGFAERSLERVVDGRGSIVQPLDIRETGKGSEEIRV